MFARLPNKLALYAAMLLSLGVICLASVQHVYVLLFVIAGALAYVAIRKDAIYYVVIPALLAYQLYLPLAVSVTLSSLVLVMLLLRSASQGKLMHYFRTQRLVRYYVALLIAMGVGIIYAPDRVLGFKLIAYSIIGLLALLAGYYYRTRGLSVEQTLRGIQHVYLPIGLLNIYFIIAPDLELQFLRSKIASFLIEPNTLAALINVDIKANILDPYKAGTLFVNTNVASVFFGMMLCIALSLLLRKGSLLQLGICFIYLGAMLATQSRAGVLALGIVVLAYVCIRFRVQKLFKLSLLLVIPAAIIPFIVTGDIITNLTSRLNADAIEGDPRTYIWKFTFQNFAEHPLLGLGYGGWERIFPFYAATVGFSSKYPPHNLFVIMWTWSGLFGLIALILLLFGILWRGIRLYYRTGSALDSCVVGAALFVIVQGMFDNFFLHDLRVASVFFFLAGLILYEQRKDSDGELSSMDGRSQSGKQAGNGEGQAVQERALTPQTAEVGGK
ncbi:O-antigen ligase like membrane protein [Paenibacillus algorifonticola]|uniref:O-antigen ligase like membrane protein n=1 Tax=Paenibacillus algorifonticola TaxID=684063 RepID=A0A1I2GQF3_9BACL|nr:O-antigen ligase family protein [Paenibacillus algorifonticola]SFF19270.1 O-antigen ligase like membrane protein [Paenibacillus algorifonticola]